MKLKTFSGSDSVEEICGGSPEPSEDSLLHRRLPSLFRKKLYPQSAKCRLSRFILSACVLTRCSLSLTLHIRQRYETLLVSDGLLPPVEEWTLNSVRPVCTVRVYVGRSRVFRRSNQLFVSWAPSHKEKPISQQRLSHWIMDAIRIAYESILAHSLL